MRATANEAARAAHPQQSADAKKIADLYTSFTAEPRLETVGIAPLHESFSRLAALTSKQEIPGLIAQSGLGLRDRDYYLKDDANLKEARAKPGEPVISFKPMRAAVEISMYPLTAGYRTMIRAFIDRLKSDPELVVRSNTLSTQLWGDLEHLMLVLTREMRFSADAGTQLVFVFKVLPGIAPPEL